MQKKSIILGYIRVSKSNEQDTLIQVKALKKSGAKKIFEDKASGGRCDRPKLHRILD